MNDRLYEANKTNYGQNAKPIDVLSSFSFRITRNASNWIENNLPQESTYEDPKPKFIDSSINLKANYSEKSEISRK